MSSVYMSLVPSSFVPHLEFTTGARNNRKMQREERGAEPRTTEGAPAAGSPVRASFPVCVRPFLEDVINEVWYRWAR